MRIKTVTVIGATGTMGANVAGIFASFGDAKVFCVGRDIEKVKKTVPRIVQSVRADSIAANLIPSDFSMLEECVGESDLVFESSPENMEIKSAVAKRVGAALRPGAVSCTGSSGLSIRSLAECYPEEHRDRFFGVHMFNPPYTMSLCEVIPTEYSDKEVFEGLKRYLREKLYRTVVEVKDSPAFLGNRIGFYFINEALRYAEKYKDYGGIDYMDAVLGPFTGRTMAPLVTSDFVGLDVHRAIVDNIYNNTNDYTRASFVFPEFAKKLIAEGKLGRKSSMGLYQFTKLDNGEKHRAVYDINSESYRDVIPYAFPFADKMKKHIREGDYRKALEQLVGNESQEAVICLSFLLKYIVYALYAAENIGDTIHAADDVMATGFNWCPPLAMYGAFSEVTDVSALIKERLPDICKLIDTDRYLDSIERSKYDHRRYFKSGGRS